MWTFNIIYGLQSSTSYITQPKIQGSKLVYLAQIILNCSKQFIQFRELLFDSL